MSETSSTKNADPRRDLMLAALSDGCTWEEAADRVGVSDRTLYRWCAADPELAAKAAKAKSAADDMVEAIAFANCIDPDPAHNTLRMFWLKSRRRDVYGERVDTEHKGVVRIDVTYVNDWRSHGNAPEPIAGS